MFAPLLLLLVGLAIFVLPGRLYRLAALLGLAGLLYLLFINVYWHYEARYFLVWLPFLDLLGVYGLGWLYDKLKDTRPGPAVWLVTLSVVVLSVPSM